MTSTAELGKHQWPSTMGENLEEQQTFPEIQILLLSFPCHINADLQMQNLAPESEPREEAAYICLKLPVKDLQHLLEQLCTKQGQEVVWMPANIITYLQATPKLAWSCVQTFAIMNSMSGIALGPPSKNMRKTKDELATEH